MTLTSLSTLLPLQNILLDINAFTMTDLFEQIGQFFAERYSLPKNTIIKNLLDRETLGSTGLGQGVAIPHGRIEGLLEPHAALVRVHPPLTDFEVPDEHPVNLLFFLLVPEQATEQHLEILSKIAQLLSDKKTRETLQKETASHIRELLLQQQE